MNALDTNRITRIAPYRVWSESGEYRFETDHGILYAVNFEPESMLGGIPAYWFGLANRSQMASPGDVKIRLTATPQSRYTDSRKTYIEAPALCR